MPENGRRTTRHGCSDGGKSLGNDLATVRQRMIDQHDVEAQLDALPKFNTLRFFPLPQFEHIELSRAIEIGSSQESSLFACLEPTGDHSEYEVRYFERNWQEEEWDGENFIRKNEMSGWKLHHPFTSFNKGTHDKKSTREKGKMDALIKWYFYLEGEITLGIGHPLDEFCTGLNNALRSIDGDGGNEVGSDQRLPARLEQHSGDKHVRRSRHSGVTPPVAPRKRSLSNRASSPAAGHSTRKRPCTQESDTSIPGKINFKNSSDAYQQVERSREEIRRMNAEKRELEEEIQTVKTRLEHEYKPILEETQRLELNMKSTETIVKELEAELAQYKAKLKKDKQKLQDNKTRMENEKTDWEEFMEEVAEKESGLAASLSREITLRDKAKQYIKDDLEKDD